MSDFFYETREGALFSFSLTVSLLATTTSKHASIRSTKQERAAPCDTPAGRSLSYCTCCTCISLVADTRIPHLASRPYPISNRASNSLPQVERCSVGSVVLLGAASTESCRAPQSITIDTTRTGRFAKRTLVVEASYYCNCLMQPDFRAASS